MVRTRRLTLIAWVGLALAPPAARADGPAIPVRDLPPFPDVESEEDKVIGVAVVGAAHAEEDVVVGAAKREQSLGTVASAVTVISADRLRRFGYRTLAEALSSVVGVYMVDDRMVERVGMRGIQLLGDANTRILVLVDGTPLNEPWSQFVDTSYALPVHLDDVARIEIIRGPVSSIYGTNAFFGIINIVTLEADKAPRAYGRTGFGSFGSITANAGFGYGDVNRQVRGSVGWLNRGGEEVRYEELGDQDIDADGIDALNGSVVVHYDRLFFHLRAYDRARELPGAPFNSDVGADNRNQDRHLLGEAGYTRDLSERITLAGRAYVDLYRFENFLHYGDGMTVFRTEADSLWYGGELRGLFELLDQGRLALTAGLAAEQSDTGSKGFDEGMEASAVEVDKSFSIAGAYLEATTEPTEYVAATAGARYDRNSEFDNKLSPRGALFVKWGERVGLKLLYAQGFRNPSIFESFFADGRLYRPSGNALFPELITSYEAVVWGRPLAGLNLRASVFRWDLEKLIEKRSVFDPDALATRLQFQNLGRLDSTGAELEASYRDTAGWIGFASATWVKVVRNDDADELVPNAPELTATVGASSPLLADLFHLSTDLNFIGARHTRDEDIDAAAFIGWNAALYLPDYRGFDLTVGARNLLGTREEVPAQSDYDREDPDIDVLTVPGPGREVFARLGYRY